MSEHKLVTLVKSGPYHDLHICKNKECRSVVQVHRLENKKFPARLMSTSFLPNGQTEDVYSTPSSSQGYTCPQCKRFNDLWEHLNEYTEKDLKKLETS